ncbi:hypothetical protein LINPERHAP2_LOCUS16929 [Linum perenne]
MAPLSNLRTSQQVEEFSATHKDINLQPLPLILGDARLCVLNLGRQPWAWSMRGTSEQGKLTFSWIL